MKFFVGLHQPAHAKHFDRAFISINRVRGRRTPVLCGEWILDSGAFTEISKYGKYRDDEDIYAAQVNRLATLNRSNLVAAVSQDYMCEDVILQKTGLTIEKHQKMTIARYDCLRILVTEVYLMPVLQGYAPQDYVKHIWMYGKRLQTGAYVGVGSVCKRNGSVGQTAEVFKAIKSERPDLRIHGFGLKLTSLGHADVRDRLHSADSMAWSLAARRQMRDGNAWQEAARFLRRIETMPVQIGMGI